MDLRAIFRTIWFCPRLSTSYHNQGSTSYDTYCMEFCREVKLHILTQVQWAYRKKQGGLGQEALICVVTGGWKHMEEQVNHILCFHQHSWTNTANFKIPYLTSLSLTQDFNSKKPEQLEGAGVAAGRSEAHSTFRQVQHPWPSCKMLLFERWDWRESQILLSLLCPTPGP